MYGKIIIDCTVYRCALCVIVEAIDLLSNNVPLLLFLLF